MELFLNLCVYIDKSVALSITYERKGSIFMKRKNFILSLMLITVTVLLLVSCGDSNKGYAGSDPMYDGYYNDSNGAPEKGEISADIEIKDYSKIIKTITAYGETKDYDKCIEDVKALVIRQNGYVESSNVSGNSYNSVSNRRRASFVFRIPSANLEVFKDELSKLLNITNLTENAQNVSEQYYDIEAIIETLSAERDGLLNIIKSLDNSTQYDYWIKITERLSDIEKQIAVYKAQLKNLDNKITYSTYTLTIEEVKEYTEEAPEGFGQRIATAIKESWKSFGENAQNFAVFVVYAIPTLLTLGAIGGTVAFIVIRSDRKTKQKKLYEKDEKNDHK